MTWHCWHGVMSSKLPEACICLVVNKCPCFTQIAMPYHASCFLLKVNLSHTFQPYLAGCSGMWMKIWSNDSKWQGFFGATPRMPLHWGSLLYYDGFCSLCCCIGIHHDKQACSCIIVWIVCAWIWVGIIGWLCHFSHSNAFVKSTYMVNMPTDDMLTSVYPRSQMYAPVLYFYGALSLPKPPLHLTLVLK